VNLRGSFNVTSNLAGEPFDHFFNDNSNILIDSLGIDLHSPIVARKHFLLRFSFPTPFRMLTWCVNTRWCCRSWGRNVGGSHEMIRMYHQTGLIKIDGSRQILFGSYL
jgi:hypothetical protein